MENLGSELDIDMIIPKSDRTRNVDNQEQSHHGLAESFELDEQNNDLRLSSEYTYNWKS